MRIQCQSIAGADCRKAEDFVASEQYTKPGFQELEDSLILDALMNQIEFVRQLAAARDINEFNQQISAVLKPLGFTDYLIVRKAPGGDMQVPLGTLPNDLAVAYSTAGYCRCDMALDYIEAGNLDPIFLSMIAGLVESAPLRTHTFKRNLDILALYKQFDIDDAYLIPVKSKNSEDRLLFAITSRGTDQEAFKSKINRCGPVLQLLADAVTFIGETRFYAKKARRVINPRPLRLLTVMAKQDVTLAQAAGCLNISVDTANKHMAQAKKALGTRSQANAVYLAVKRKLIST